MSFLTGFPKKHLALDEQMDRFKAIYETYCARLEAGGSLRDSHVTIIARSVLSPACRMLVAHTEELAKHGVTVQAIFARLGPAEPMSALFATLQRLNGIGRIAASLRWAHNPALLDAHEQLTLGLRMCWTGDCMRRSEDKRNALDLFEENSIGSVRLAELAFSHMWLASKPLPEEIMGLHEAAGDAMSGIDADSVAETLMEPSRIVAFEKRRAKL